MKKVLLLAVLAVAAFLGWRYWQQEQMRRRPPPRIVYDQQKLNSLLNQNGVAKLLELAVTVPSADVLQELNQYDLDSISRQMTLAMRGAMANVFVHKPAMYSRGAVFFCVGIYDRSARVVLEFYVPKSRAQEVAGLDQVPVIGPVEYVKVGRDGLITVRLARPTGR